MRFAMAGLRLSTATHHFVETLLRGVTRHTETIRPGELSYEFVNTHDGSYSREVFNGFQCLGLAIVRRLTAGMPEELRETLIRGFRERVSWWVREVSDSSDAVLTALYKRPKSKFSYTRTLRAELTGSCMRALQELGNR